MDRPSSIRSTKTSQNGGRETHLVNQNDEKVPPFPTHYSKSVADSSLTWKGHAAKNTQIIYLAVAAWAILQMERVYGFLCHRFLVCFNVGHDDDKMDLERT